MDERTQEAPQSFSSIRRWLRAVFSHFGFVIFMGIMLVLAAAPAAVFLYGFMRSGSLILLGGAVLTFGLIGIVWSAVNRTAWDLQFSFPMYLFKTFFQYIKNNALQGYVLGEVFGILWLLALSPLLLAQIAPASLSLSSWGLAASICLIVVLTMVTSFAFYQVGRWQLSVRQILMNSLIFLFGTGLPGIATAVLWVAFLVAAVALTLYVLPLCLFLGLPVILCITTQSFFVPKVDGLMAQAASE